MRTFLAILFLTLYFGNSVICELMYPDAATVHSEWVKYAAMKDIFYEFMFISVLISPFFKKSKYDKSIYGAAITLVFFSAVDKIQGITQYDFHDLYVVLFALLICYYVYKFYKKRDEN